MSIISGLAIASVGAASAPKVTATVRTLSPTSRVVHIVNHDRVTYREFIVQSINAPRILSANLADKRCPVQHDGNFNGTTFTTRYRADCKKALASGKSLNVGLKTSASGGKIVVFVDVNDNLIRISK